MRVVIDAGPPGSQEASPLFAGLLLLAVCLLLVSYKLVGVDGALLVLCRRSATCQLLS